MNYWWGMSSGWWMDVRIDPSLPDGVQHLAEILKQGGIVDGSIDPFHRLISSQDGALRNDGNQWYSLRRFSTWTGCVTAWKAASPPLTSCCPCPRPWSGSKGVYRDRIPPGKGGDPPVKILLVSDEECLYLWDYYRPGRLDGIDLILSCGDLNAEYLSFLVTMGRAPVLYVHGNHDGGYDKHPPEGCTCIEDQVVCVGGLRILGRAAAPWYSRRPPSVHRAGDGAAHPPPPLPPLPHRRWTLW